VVFLREATIIELVWKTPCPDESLTAKVLKTDVPPI